VTVSAEVRTVADDLLEYAAPGWSWERLAYAAAEVDSTVGSDLYLDVIRAMQRANVTARLPEREPAASEWYYRYRREHVPAVMRHFSCRWTMLAEEDRTARELPVTPDERAVCFFLEYMNSDASDFARRLWVEKGNEALAAALMRFLIAHLDRSGEDDGGHGLGFGLRSDGGIRLVRAILALALMDRTAINSAIAQVREQVADSELTAAFGRILNQPAAALGDVIELASRDLSHLQERPEWRHSLETAGFDFGQAVGL
jgi:hypothetical protein